MIRFLISGQQLKIVTPVVVSDTHDYLSAEAVFRGSEWTGLYKWAHFTLNNTTYDIPFNDNKILPSQQLDLTAGTWKVFITGNSYEEQDGGSVLVTRATTTTALLKVESADSSTPFPAITPSFSEVLAAEVEQARSDAASVKAAAAAGEYTGTTFTPSVNSNGVISWTNDHNKPNPDPVSIRGPKGDIGAGFQVKGFFTSYADLTSSVSDPDAGDAYGVGTNKPYDFYVWDDLNDEWKNIGNIQGVSAGFGAVYATINNSYGVPSVNVTSEGLDTEKVFRFAFSNLKGYTPVKGTDYFTAAEITSFIQEASGRISPAMIGAIADPENKSANQILEWNGSKWVAGNKASGVTSVNGQTSQSVTTRLIFENVTVPASSWSLTSTYDDYPYEASIPLTGVTNAMIPDVKFSMDQLVEGVYSGLSETYTGGVYIYAYSNPGEITIPTIICWR